MPTCPPSSRARTGRPRRRSLVKLRFRIAAIELERALAGDPGPEAARARRRRGLLAVRRGARCGARRRDRYGRGLRAHRGGRSRGRYGGSARSGARAGGGAARAPGARRDARGRGRLARRPRAVSKQLAAGGLTRDLDAAREAAAPPPARLVAIAGPGRKRRGPPTAPRALRTRAWSPISWRQATRGARPRWLSCAARGSPPDRTGRPTRQRSGCRRGRRRPRRRCRDRALAVPRSAAAAKPPRARRPAALDGRGSSRARDRRMGRARSAVERLARKSRPLTREPRADRSPRRLRRVASLTRPDGAGRGARGARLRCPDHGSDRRRSRRGRIPSRGGDARLRRPRRCDRGVRRDRCAGVAAWRRAARRPERA